MISKMILQLSIAQKTVCLIVLVSMLSIMITIAGLSINQFQSSQIDMKREVITLSNVIAKNMTAAIVFKDSFAAQELLDALKYQPMIEYAKVENSEHSLVVTYGTAHTLASIEKEGLLQFNVPLMFDDKKIGHMMILANNIEYDKKIKVYLSVVMSVIFISLVFSVLLSIWVQRRFATPIIHLAKIANEIAESGNYHLRAQSNFKGEIGQLISVFNGMLNKIDGREQELEALVLHRTQELELLNQQLANQAYHDSLTKLPNRSLFEDRLKQSIAHAAREGTQVALMFIDLDNFKEVNDTWGHAAGDALLCQVARRLESQCRKMDSVARIGGDEFTLLLILEEDDDISEISRRIIDIFQVPFDILDKPLLITMSIGVAIYPIHGYDYDVLKTKSDEAMYQAKRLGRNQFCIHQ